MKHLDLFSGIGGFAYAADTVFGDDVTHVFCDNDNFCRAVLRKHWPESEVFSDIRSIKDWGYGAVDILTGGFPCQPFSAAGLKRGTADERHLWPEMLRVIRLTQPEWVVAENVNGLLTWSGGMVFEQVCTDLEAAGYEVQPFIIPAAGLGAPHKRDRIWICAHSNSPEHSRRGVAAREADSIPEIDRPSIFPWKLSGTNQDADWQAVATELCGMDDGLPVELDGLKLTGPGHQAAQIKAYGNAIVPQVAMEIMWAIKHGQA